MTPKSPFAVIIFGIGPIDVSCLVIGGAFGLLAHYNIHAVYLIAGISVFCYWLAGNPLAAVAALVGLIPAAAFAVFIVVPPMVKPYLLPGAGSDSAALLIPQVSGWLLSIGLALMVSGIPFLFWQRRGRIVAARNRALWLAAVRRADEDYKADLAQRLARD